MLPWFIHLRTVRPLLARRALSECALTQHANHTWTLYHGKRQQVPCWTCSTPLEYLGEWRILRTNQAALPQYGERIVCKYCYLINQEKALPLWSCAPPSRGYREQQLLRSCCPCRYHKRPCPERGCWVSGWTSSSQWLRDNHLISAHVDLPTTEEL
jgi:hypothetical protein